jgi:dTDP-4-amino-4,6-dideoxygalactose transaminase
MRKIIFGQPVISEDEINEVVDTLRSGWIGTGPKCMRFEQQFARYIGARNSLAVSSCTAALHLSLIVSGIKKDDEVITTPLTFAATLNSIWHIGARPVLVDVDPVTFNIDPTLIENAITEKTKAIIPVHFGGLACDMDEINRIAKKYRLVVIEDAAHAVGGVYEGKKIGSSVNLTCFSFYANKNITTAEGGMISFQEDRLADEIKTWRLHGLSGDAWRRYSSEELIISEAVCPGYKYNMTDLQASLGIWQLKKIDDFLVLRERYANIYDSYLKNISGISLQFRPADLSKNRHALHLYVVVLNKREYSDKRNKLVSMLRKEGIGAAIHYEAIHRHKFYKENLGYKKDSLPVSENIGANTISLPLTPAMTEDDVHFVAQTFVELLKTEKKEQRQ